MHVLGRLTLGARGGLASTGLTKLVFLTGGGGHGNLNGVVGWYD